jgi:hypothetical protein
MSAGASEVPKIVSEKDRMSVEFASSNEFMRFALRERIAPKEYGSVKERITFATRQLRRRGWSSNRVKDAWYADPRIKPNADEIRDLEEMTGLRYGREELRTNQQLIDRATALLEGSDPDFYRPLIAAFHAMARAFNSPGAGD